MKVILLLLVSINAIASVPLTFTYQGKLLEQNGTPLQSNVSFKIQLYDPSGSCLLYEEDNANVSLSDGLFSLQIGSDTTSSKRSANDPGMSMDKVFSNSGSVLRAIDPSSCPYGFSPNTNDKRKMKVTVTNLSNGTVHVLAPMQDITTNPFSMVADQSDNAAKLNGKLDTSFIQVKTSSNLTQANLEAFIATITAAAGNSVKWDGSSFVAYNPTAGLVSEADPTVQNFAKQTPGVGLQVVGNQLQIKNTDISIVKSQITDLPTFGTATGKNVPSVGNAANGEVVLGSDTRLTDSRSPNGNAGGDLTGSFPNPSLKNTGTPGNYTKITTDAQGRVTAGGLIQVSDVKSSVTGAWFTASGACPAGKMLTYTSVSDTLSCQDYAVTSAQVISALGFTPANSSASGTVTSVSSANADIAVATGGTTPVLTLNSGTSANQILKLDGNGKLPNVDGSALTNISLGWDQILNATAKYLDYKPNGIACTDGQTLNYTSGTGWICANAGGGGSVTSVTAAGTAGNPISVGGTGSAPTIDLPKATSSVSGYLSSSDWNTFNSKQNANSEVTALGGISTTGIMQRTGANTYGTLGTTAPINVTVGNIGISIGTGLTTNAGSLVPDFGTASGKIAQGNDSRFPASVCASGNKSRWDGTTWQCETDSTGSSSQWTTATNDIYYSTGKVGIGTSSPAQALDVSGNIKISNGSNSAIIQVPASGGALNYTLPTSAGTNGQCLATNGAGVLTWQNNGGGASTQWTTNGSNIGYSAGKVGVGTTSPTYSLQVQKTAIGTPALMIGGGFPGGPRIQTYGLDADAAAWMGLGTDMGAGSYEHSIFYPVGAGAGKLTFGTYDGTTYTEKMRLNQAGLLTVNSNVNAERFQGKNSLVINDFQTVNPTSNVTLYGSPNDRDNWIYLDPGDTSSNWGIYHRQIDSTVKNLPANSIGFIGGGSSGLQGYISLANGNAYHAGSLGIGNVAPSYNLDVTGTARITGATSLSSTLAVSGASTFSSSISATGSITGERFKTPYSVVLNDFQTVNPSSNVVIQGSPTDRDSWLFLDPGDTSSNWGIYHRQLEATVKNLPGNSIAFVGGGASTLQSYISLTNGNAFFAGMVGIGNNSPTYNLDVTGSTRITSNATVGGVLSVAGNANFSSNFGVGTTSYEGTAIIQKDNAGAMGANLVLANKGTNTTGSAVAIDFGVDNSTVANGAGNAQIKVINTNGANSAADMAFSTYNGSAIGERLRILSSGNVGIGTSSPTYQLQLSTDSAAKPGTSTWTIASDERLKDIRAPFTRGLASLEEIQPIYFKYKSDNPLHLPNDKEYVGVRAQEVQKVVPEAVATDKDGYLHVTNDALIWTIFNSVKELYQIVQEKIAVQDSLAEVHQSELTNLKIENSKLYQEVESLKTENKEIKQFICNQTPSASFCK